MTNEEHEIVERFAHGWGTQMLAWHYEKPTPDIEAILRKALKAQDKKKGKA